MPQTTDSTSATANDALLNEPVLILGCMTPLGLLAQPGLRTSLRPYRPLYKSPRRKPEGKLRSARARVRASGPQRRARAKTITHPRNAPRELPQRPQRPQPGRLIHRTIRHRLEGRALSRTGPTAESPLQLAHRPSLAPGFAQSKRPEGCEPAGRSGRVAPSVSVSLLFPGDCRAPVASWGVSLGSTSTSAPGWEAAASASLGLTTRTGGRPPRIMRSADTAAQWASTSDEAKGLDAPRNSCAVTRVYRCVESR
jgi:hypothetical protein